MIVALPGRIARSVNVGRYGQLWLVLYNQADVVLVLKKHLVIGQFVWSRF